MSYLIVLYLSFYNSSFQPRITSPLPEERSAMSGHNLEGAAGIWWVEKRDATVHRTVPPQWP